MPRQDVIDEAERICRAERARRAAATTCACGKPATCAGNLCTTCSWDEFEADNRAEALDQQRD